MNVAVRLVDAGVAKRMSRQRRTDTSPEVSLRRALFKRGLRYRLQVNVPGRPRRTIDIAFPGRRLAVFVDGCFWHVCPEHATWPHNNEQWWRQKLLANVKRDRDTDIALEDAGWRVLRFWEHEGVEQAVERIHAAWIDR